MKTQPAPAPTQFEENTNPVLKHIYSVTQQFSVYILSSVNDALLYIGQTENLQSKVWLHKKRTTDHLGLTIFEQKLVYVEQFDNVVDARTREQELTMLPEIDLRKIITTNNPKWDDLFEFV
ncbi:GIY-YIG nuclease family protein [Vibrio breoganii]|uniref:GIY-YIG domain-containing protein n=1 Tax=Vibrio breoganii TaxID=553239 RepID=A0AAP8SW38_9VIBR|nr:GIY-YIG nuclease family protein [Vibrio breoganii]PMM16504.1 hypothetical protein BCT59_16015 [Vibrio breoganii]PMP09196.1 hypothetical protein BCS93_03260 [Vibrio breoganii]